MVYRYLKHLRKKKNNKNKFLNINYTNIYESFKHWTLKLSPLFLQTKSNILYFFCTARDVSSSYIVFKFNKTSS